MLKIYISSGERERTAYRQILLVQQANVNGPNMRSYTGWNIRAKQIPDSSPPEISEFLRASVHGIPVSI